jgi:hypothetical protein
LSFLCLNNIQSIIKKYINIYNEFFEHISQIFDHISYLELITYHEMAEDNIINRRRTILEFDKFDENIKKEEELLKSDEI